MTDVTSLYNKNIKEKINSQRYQNGIYIVATPIGNILDISIRALAILQKADVILSEDTRVTMKLLNFYEIHNKKLVSFNDIVENKNIDKFLEIIAANPISAIVSDAGTPLISDPGFKLIREAIRKNIKIFSIPGACSPITALTLSGLPSNEFLFKGFLSPKPGTKANQLLKFKEYDGTIIILESPYKIVSTIEAILNVFGDVQMAVAREMTKQFEEIIRGNASFVLEKLSNQHEIKGEFVIVFNKSAENNNNFMNNINQTAYSTKQFDDEIQ